jgi:hypothetical protein
MRGIFTQSTDVAAKWNCRPGAALYPLSQVPRTEDDMLRRGLRLFGCVVAALLASVATRPSAQASTIDLILAGPFQVKPGQPTTIDFDRALHPTIGPTIGIVHDNVTFVANAGNGSAVPRGGPLLTLSNASSLAIGRTSAPSPVTRIVQVHVLPLPSGGLLLLTALAPLAGFVVSRRALARDRQRRACSPSQ